MDGYEFTAALVGSLAWPIGAVGITAMLRKPIGGLLSRAKSGELFGAKLEFGEAVEAIREVVENTPPQIVEANKVVALPESIEPSHHFTAERLPDTYSDELALTSATGSVAVAWRELENSLREVISEVGAPWHRSNLQASLSALVQHGVINEDTSRAIADLKMLRNQVLHSPEVGISLPAAASYRATVNSIVANLNATRFVLRQNQVDP